MISRCQRGGRGSIPRWRIYLASVAQLAARGSHNPKVVGSTPTGGMFLHPTRALVAQLAALRSYEPMVQGSSPCRSIFCPSQCGWMAEWSKALVLGTSLFGGVGSNPTSVTILDLAFKRKAAPAGARTLDHRLIRPMRCQLRHKSIIV